MYSVKTRQLAVVSEEEGQWTPLYYRIYAKKNPVHDYEQGFLDPAATYISRPSPAKYCGRN